MSDNPTWDHDRDQPAANRPAVDHGVYGGLVAACTSLLYAAPEMREMCERRIAEELAYIREEVGL